MMRFRKRTQSEPMVTMTQAQYNELIAAVIAAQVAMVVKSAVDEGFNAALKDLQES